MEKGTPGLQGWASKGQTGHPRQQHLRVDFRRLRGTRSKTVSASRGKGYKIAIETLNEGRIGIGAQMLGLAEGAWGRAARYPEGAEAIRQGNRRIPGVQFTLAQMAAEWRP